MGKVSAEGVKRYCGTLYKSGAVYLWGADVEIITADLLERLRARFGTRRYSTVSLERVEGRIGADCSGMLYPLSGADNTAAGYYKTCIKKDAISKLPKDKVCLIFRKEGDSIVHVAVYTGDGMLYEMMNGCEHRKFIESQWTYYGIPEWIEQPDKVLAIGDEVEIGDDVKGYYTAKDAEDGTNAKHTLVPGKYYVYKLHGKAINVSKIKGNKGSWILLKNH